MKLVSITSIKTKHYKGKVYDLTVKDNHSYNINGIVVHNSLCETRIRTGVGIPQATAITDVYKVTKGSDVSLIADGGIKTSGDFAKAIALGADSVMLGSLLAGTKESPGRIIEEGIFPNEIKYKLYRGSASVSAKMDRGESPTHVEGNSRKILYKGPVKRIINAMDDGLRSAMTYVGANSISEFRKNSRFCKVTESGKIEAKPHLLFE